MVEYGWTAFWRFLFLYILNLKGCNFSVFGRASIHNRFKPNCCFRDDCHVELNSYDRCSCNSFEQTGWNTVRSGQTLLSWDSGASLFRPGVHLSGQVTQEWKPQLLLKRSPVHGKITSIQFPVRLLPLLLLLRPFFFFMVTVSGAADSPFPQCGG